MLRKAASRATHSTLCSSVAAGLSPIEATALQNLLQGLEETFLLARLTFRLLYFLGLGWRWNVQLWRLLVYAFLLLPGFIQACHTDPSIKEFRRAVEIILGGTSRLEDTTPALICAKCCIGCRWGCST